MYKQKKIFLLILMVIMTLFLSSIIWAEERTIFFEKGDALYRRGKIPGGSWWFGHCGLYYEWIDLNGEGEPNNPDDFATHRVIESVGGQGVHGCAPEDIFTFTQFDCTKFWGVYTNSDLTAAQRQLIIDTAKLQKDCEYAFFRGYKNPSHYDKHGNWILGSFRCDGLVEYCYEIAFDESWKPGNNKGLVLNDTWRRLKPTKQMESERLTKRTEAEVKEVRLEPSEDGTLEAYASDGDYGSGITMVEFWDGEPDDTPGGAPGGVRLGKDNRNVNVGGEYTYYYGGTVTDLYAKAFDQAGNTKIAKIEKGTGAISAIVYRSEYHQEAWLVRLRVKNTYPKDWLNGTLTLHCMTNEYAIDPETGEELEVEGWYFLAKEENVTILAGEEYKAFEAFASAIENNQYNIYGERWYDAYYRFVYQGKLDNGEQVKVQEYFDIHNTYELPLLVADYSSGTIEFKSSYPWGNAAITDWTYKRSQTEEHGGLEPTICPFCGDTHKRASFTFWETTEHSRTDTILNIDDWDRTVDGNPYCMNHYHGRVTPTERTVTCDWYSEDPPYEEGCGGVYTYTHPGFHFFLFTYHEGEGPWHFTGDGETTWDELYAPYRAKKGVHESWVDGVCIRPWREGSGVIPEGTRVTWYTTPYMEFTREDEGRTEYEILQWYAGEFIPQAGDWTWYYSHGQYDW